MKVLDTQQSACSYERGASGDSPPYVKTRPTRPPVRHEAVLPNGVLTMCATLPSGRLRFVMLPNESLSLVHAQICGRNVPAEREK